VGKSLLRKYILKDSGLSETEEAESWAPLATASAN